MIGLTESCSSLQPIKSMSARLLASFYLRLNQLGLIHTYSPKDILSEAKRRLKAAITEGKTIRSREAWLRTTGFLYILEIKYNHNHAMTSCAFDCSIPQRYQLVLEAMQMLDIEERQLLEMRLLEKLSWEQIAQRFLHSGETVSVEAIRQRGCRAMRAFRKAYRSRL